MNDSENDQPEKNEAEVRPEVEERIVELLRQGNKVQAIKDYSQSTGAGLKESKEAVEALSNQQAMGEDKDRSEIVEQIVESLRQGNKIQAIKDYRESTGAGLKESKEAIEALIQKYDISMKSGCASMLLVAFSAVTLFFIAWLR